MRTASKFLALGFLLAMPTVACETFQETPSERKADAPVPYEQQTPDDMRDQDKKQKQTETPGQTSE